MTLASRTLLAGLALGVAASALHAAPATACDPAYDPACQTFPCSDARSWYTRVHDTVGRGPTWDNLDLGVCGT